MKSNTKKYGVDILILGLSALAAYGIVGIFYMLLKIDLGALPLLAQTLVGAFCEFGLMGLGVVIICIRNKESFKSFGLKKEKLLLTMALSAFSCLPTFLFLLLTNETISYFPLQNVNFTKPVLAAGFPVNVIGMLIIVVTWGFFEGFSYVVISDRINKLFPSKSLLADRGQLFAVYFVW